MEALTNASKRWRWDYSKSEPTGGPVEEEGTGRGLRWALGLGEHRLSVRPRPGSSDEHKKGEGG